jgi:glutathione S-transferase
LPPEEDDIGHHPDLRRATQPVQVTAADLFLVPIFFYFSEIAELKALAEASPNCGRWARDMGARPSVKATDPQFRGLNR